jgi:hypothetical protein
MSMRLLTDDDFDHPEIMDEDLPVVTYNMPKSINILPWVRCPKSGCYRVLTEYSVFFRNQIDLAQAKYKEEGRSMTKDEYNELAGEMMKKIDLDPLIRPHLNNLLIKPIRAEDLQSNIQDTVEALSTYTNAVNKVVKELENVHCPVKEARSLTDISDKNLLLVTIDKIRDDIEFVAQSSVLLLDTTTGEPETQIFNLLNEFKYPYAQEWLDSVHRSEMIPNIDSLLTSYNTSYIAITIKSLYRDNSSQRGLDGYTFQELVSYLNQPKPFTIKSLRSIQERATGQIKERLTILLESEMSKLKLLNVDKLTMAKLMTSEPIMSQDRLSKYVKELRILSKERLVIFMEQSKELIKVIVDSDIFNTTKYSSALDKIKRYAEEFRDREFLLNPYVRELDLNEIKKRIFIKRAGEIKPLSGCCRMTIMEQVHTPENPFAVKTTAEGLDLRFPPLKSITGNKDRAELPNTGRIFKAAGVPSGNVRLQYLEKTVPYNPYSFSRKDLITSPESTDVDDDSDYISDPDSTFTNTRTATTTARRKVVTATSGVQQIQKGKSPITRKGERKDLIRMEDWDEVHPSMPAIDDDNFVKEVPQTTPKSSRVVVATVNIGADRDTILVKGRPIEAR